LFIGLYQAGDALDLLRKDIPSSNEDRRSLNKGRPGLLTQGISNPFFLGNDLLQEAMNLKIKEEPYHHVPGF
jgi:hypothetical protein